MTRSAQMNRLRCIYGVTLLFVASMLAAQVVTPPFSRLQLLFAGDLMQHDSQLNAARRNDGTYSYSSCFRYIKHDVSAADLAIANLEVVLGGSRYGGYPSFCAPDSFLYAVRDAGFDVLLFANNHCLDRGSRGALRTLQMMDSLGLEHCGVYRDSADRASRYPLMLDRQGVRVALLNYTYDTNGIPVPAPLIVNMIDKDVIAADIARAKALRADVVIACMHWGDEFVSLPPERIRRLASWLIEQGVDHVIGNHPHVLQPVELRRNACTPARNAVVYSLGNLISGMYARGRDGGMLLRLGIQKFCGITRLHSLRYAFTWVARPHRDGVDNFTIYPAADSPSGLGEATKRKLDEFLNDSRTLFEKYNKGAVQEYFINEKR